MAQIIIKPNQIQVEGHATNKIACAMGSALTVGLLKNCMERYDFEPRFTLTSGHFLLDTDKFEGEPKVLLNAFVYSLCNLAEDYPDDYQVIHQDS